MYNVSRSGAFKGGKHLRITLTRKWSKTFEEKLSEEYARDALEERSYVMHDFWGKQIL